jgi:hypothetical protein
MRTAIALVALVVVLAAVPARAADWGGVVPGTSVLESVRTLFGPPSRATTQKVDKYDATQWVYEDKRAPSGMRRMVVDFGLLVGTNYLRDVVRSITLEPKPNMFNVDIVLQGWGYPQRESPPGQPIALVYDIGLLVYFAEDGRTVTSMIFTPPLPPAAAPAAKQP